MERVDVILPADATRDLPEVRSIGLHDLRDALTKGLEDFWAMPTHVVFLSLIYPIAGIAIGWATLGYDVIPLLYPIATGFALIGPIAAIGLYELSRRREMGLDTSWTHAFDVRHSPSFPAIVAVGLLLLAIFGIWLAMAHAIYVATFGYREPVALPAFVQDVLTTREGHSLIVIGNIVGFACVTAMDVWGVVSGSARPIAKLFLVIHLLMTITFVVAGRAAMRARRA